MDGWLAAAAVGLSALKSLQDLLLTSSDHLFVVCVCVLLLLLLLSRALVRLPSYLVVASASDALFPIKCSQTI